MALKKPSCYYAGRLFKRLFKDSDNLTKAAAMQIIREVTGPADEEIPGIG
jgi:hypothetical protein